MSFKVDIKNEQEGVYIVSLDGRLDSDTYISFEEKIEPLLVASTKALVLDMSKLNYISSAGLGVVFNVRKIIEENKGLFIMTSLQPQIKKIFQIVKGWPGKAIFASMEEADSYLDFMQR